MRHLAPGFMGSLLLFAFACGGKVVVESTNSTGAGGTGTGGNGDGGFFASTGDGSPVSVVSAASSGTGGPSLCEQVCAKFEAEGCAQANCAADCQQQLGFGACSPQFQSLAACLVTTSDPICDYPKECDSQIMAYGACTQPGTCGDMGCSVGPGGECSCTGVCNGSTFQVQCTPGNATDFCTCIKDGVPIGKCTEPQDNGVSCDINVGCCAAQFFP